MTTDLVRYDAQSSLELAPQAWGLAERIAQTDFVPPALRGKPEAVLACILAGHEAGVSPMQALAKIHVIEGRPAMSAELMRAIVLRAGHEIWLEESSSTKAIACGKRAGSSRVSRVEWTMDDAKRAQLDQRQNWRKFPRAMLAARATAELCRSLFPDVLAGISYAVEELQDDPSIADGTIPARPELDAATPPKAKARARKAATADATATATEAPATPRQVGEVPDLPEPEPASAPADPDGEIVDAELVDEEEWSSADWPSADWGEPVPAPEDRRTLTGPQMIAVRMDDVFGLRGTGDTVRAARLALICAILGRESLTSSKDLTGDELGRVLRELNEWPDTRSIVVTDPAGNRAEVFPKNYPHPADEPPPTLPQDDSPAPTLPMDGPEAAPAKSGGDPVPVGDPAGWHSAEWRTFLGSRRVKATEVIAQARTMGLANVRNLDDLHGWSGCDDLLGFVEDLALSR